MVDAAYNDRRLVCEKVAKLLNLDALRDANESDLSKIENQILESEYQKALYVVQENRRVLEAAEQLKNNNIIALGKLLFESHYGLQHQYEVSCKELDFLVEQAKVNTDVLGSRMMGGGFGGCTINLVKSEKAQDFSKKTTELYKYKFGFDCSVYFVELSQGTHLL